MTPDPTDAEFVAQAWQAWRILGGGALVFGLLVGSFLNVCISRMPEDRSVVWPPSHCPSCGSSIRAYDNIPVLSWLILRGKCRDCGNPISSMYPTIELLMGVLSLLLFWRFVPDPGAVDGAHGAAFAVHFVFFAMLVVVTFIDVRHYIIPDELSIYSVPIGVLASVGLAWLGAPGAVGLKASLVGAVAGAGVLVSVMLLYKLIRGQEGMGWGDPKLLAMIGAFLGALPALPFVVFVACVTGSVVGLTLMVVGRRAGWGMRSAVPFGPFLAIGAVVWVLHGPQMVERWFPGVHYLLGAV